MHEILNSFKQQPIPKFQQKLINFEKPQNQGFKTLNAWKWEIRNSPSEEKLGKTLKKPWGRSLEWVREVWEVKRWVCWERDREKWETDHAEPYIEGQKSSTDRGVERCRARRCRQIKLLRRFRGTIQQTRLKKLNRSTSCQEAIERLGDFLIDPPSSREMSRLW